MEEWKPICTLMIIGCKLSKEDESNEVDKKNYRSMIGTLLYVCLSKILQYVQTPNYFPSPNGMDLEQRNHNNVSSPYTIKTLEYQAFLPPNKSDR